jgi:hypothetical protein
VTIAENGDVCRYSYERCWDYERSWYNFNHTESCSWIDRNLIVATRRLWICAQTYEQELEIITALSCWRSRFKTWIKRYLPTLTSSNTFGGSHHTGHHCRRPLTDTTTKIQTNWRKTTNVMSGLCGKDTTVLPLLRPDATSLPDASRTDMKTRSHDFSKLVG